MAKLNSYLKLSSRMKQEVFAKRNLNPVQKSGERNYFCPFYSDCLDFAVKEAWKSWRCLECRHKTKEVINEEIFTRDFAPVYEIPSGICVD
jgi:hypothetical protein